VHPGPRVTEMALHEVLYRQGFGSRRACHALASSGAVRVAGVEQRDPLASLPLAGLILDVHGQHWPVCHHATVMLHKPAGYECSQRPTAYPSVYALLPAPLRQRPTRGQLGVQSVGRLDADTTGLLLLTDDGALLHRLASPKHRVPKVYQVRTRDPVTEALCCALCAGVVLRGEPRPVHAEAAQRTGASELTLTLTQGKYHQVKRMVAALGNRVVALHRSQVGGLTLDGLAPSAWRWLADEELAQLA
jgi:16S rRNA pseudouridine516 synthase